jgi:sugar/nucleoside kinase (ribokinase family)
MELGAAVELACRAGAYCVTKLGVLDGLATMAELEAFVARA